MPESYRILIVDDNEAERGLVKIKLRGEDFKTFDAETYEEALELIKKEVLDLIFVDYQLPTKDGIELIKAVKDYKNIPVIFMTGFGDEKVVSSAFKAGASDYISKHNLQDLLLKETCIKLINATKERERYENELNKYKEIFNSMSDPVLIHDMGGDFLEVNDAALDVFGYTRDELLKLTPKELVSEECYESFKNIDEYLKSWGYFLSDCEVKTKTGGMLQVEVSSKSFDYYGVPCIISILRDVSERKKHMEELRRSEFKYLNFLQSLSEFISKWKIDTTLTFVNKNYLKFFGLDVDVIGAKWIDFIPEAEKGGVLSVINRIVESKKEFRYEQEGKHIDGKEFAVEWIYTPFLDENGDVVEIVSTGRDILERKKFEREKEQYQSEIYRMSKLASLGELSGGVAHEVNNPVAGIQVNSDLIRSVIEGSEFEGELSDYLDNIDESIKKTTKIVNKLKTFARKTDKVLLKSDLKSVIDASLCIFESQLLAKSIDLEKDLSSGELFILCDPYELEQVFVNLLINARDALEEVEDKRIRIEAYEDNGKVVVNFIDSGPGIKEELVDKIFNPFFTTKEIGKGTGLGLSISHSIIVDHKGSIKVDRGFNGGTKFIIEFPLHKEELNEG